MECVYIEKDKDHFENLEIKRVYDNKINISWNSKKELNQVKIYWNKTPEINGFEECITTVEGKNSVTFDDPDVKRRNYFILKADGYVSEIVAEVLVPFKGTSNFRDLGGYKTKDGRKVKWNIFYRSDELAGLTEEDMEYLKSLEIKTILDYRSKGEVSVKPDPVIEGIENVNISGMKSLDNKDGNFDMTSLMKNSKSLKELGKPEEFLKNGYLEMIFENEAFKKLMEYIENTDKTPIIQHCTAGKDRTGIGAALILLALGVPEETVIEDYLLTNVYRSQFNEALIESFGNLLKDEHSKEIFKAFMEVRREYIEYAFNTIKERYGSIDDYLNKEYGINEEKRTKLKKNYLW
ncbi:tyrosine-protein phosphatase [Oceanirhabdus sp. W0125-5]|uniref:tyrosine-protein phosphatase n=1 Tax=Oceanirhabdus sp. W0125-5 TaxID=2999116 RepID=UPI0022F2B5A0|nr:tyrosine-protein phosphatase [Oceanirhabdus sp. W0125-5]WBW99233.1 tyrosine-protein phosphatase [Oceanirhabdus sp. W0125-5]